MSSRSGEALERFKGGYFCSQAVLSVFCEELGMDGLTALKVSSGFGGGMGRTGQVCGAVTGAYMALGLHYWAANPPTPDQKSKVSERIRAFNREFATRHGSIVCKDLIGCDLGTPEGSKEAAAKGVFVSICGPVVEDAVKIVEKMTQTEA
jgi:C_GCAxxG_C_C family probable redox protein